MYKQTNIFALICCGCFLAGNILYDHIDVPCPYDCATAADYRIFYVPLSLMIFSLILLSKKNSTKRLEPFWWFFMWLSVGQMVKFFLFNPFLQMLSDYGFLGIVTIGLIYKLIRNARQHTAGNN